MKPVQAALSLALVNEALYALHAEGRRQRIFGRELAPRKRSQAEKDELAAIYARIATLDAALDLIDAEADWTGGADDPIEALRLALIELEDTLIPYGLHVVGEQGGDESNLYW